MGMKLDNWSFKYFGSIHGNVYGSSKFSDGTFITTGRIVSIDPITDEVITHTGSRYELLNPHPDYEAAYPNAKQRFINSLKLAMTSCASNSIH